MANELKVIDLSGGALQVPSYLQGLSVVGNIPVGDARNRLGLKGREFHVIRGGVEEGVIETKHLDVILVGAVPHISRQFYAKAYVEGEAAAPVCYSIQGKVPEEDSLEPQSDKCANCQWNIKGSALNGQSKAKACGYLRRTAVIIHGDPDFTIFQLDMKSLSLWNDGDPSKNIFSFQEYAKKLQAHNIDPGTVITRLRFDPNAGVPALTFQAIGFATQEQIARIMDLVNSGEVAEVLKITSATIDLSAEQPQAEPEQQQQEEAIDEPTIKPTPAPRITPVARPAVQARPAVNVAPKLAQAAPKPVLKPAMKPVTVAMPPDEVDEAINRRGTGDAVEAGLAMPAGGIKYGKPRVAQRTVPVARVPSAQVEKDAAALIAELEE